MATCFARPACVPATCICWKESKLQGASTPEGAQAQSLGTGVRQCEQPCGHLSICMHRLNRLRLASNSSAPHGHDRLQPGKLLAGGRWATTASSGAVPATACCAIAQCALERDPVARIGPLQPMGWTAELYSSAGIHPMLILNNLTTLTGLLAASETSECCATLAALPSLQAQASSGCGPCGWQVIGSARPEQLAQPNPMAMVYWGAPSLPFRLPLPPLRAADLCSHKPVRPA